MATRLADNPLLKKTQSGDFGVVSVPVEAIQPSPHQARRTFDDAEIEELARSIQQVGLVQPIKVNREGETYYLVYGERRLRAIKRLGVEHLLWDSRTKLATLPNEPPNADLALQTLTENILRNDLSHIEEAEAYVNIMANKGLQTQQEVAALLGIDKRRVSEKLLLLRLPEEVKEQMAACKEITFRHARALAKLPGPEEMVSLYQRIVREGLSVVQTERIVEDALAQAHVEDAVAAPVEPQVRREVSPRSRLFRRFRRAAWQLVGTLKALQAADETLRRDWRRRFGGPNGLVAEIRMLLDSCESSGDASQAPEAQAPTACPAGSSDEIRPAE